MDEPTDILHPHEEPMSKPIPWGLIIGVSLAIGVLALIIWGLQEKKNDQSREAIVKILDQELTTSQEAIKAQRQKVMNLSSQVETLRTNIQTGQVENPKAAVAQFNALAAQQRTERDKFAAMAEVYNKKVAKFKELSE